jgi:superfamily II DNA or RNA helicase
MNYESFLENKQCVNQVKGIEVDGLRKILFPFQADLVKWALRRGRAAIFADTGLGKTLMQIEWADRVAEQAGPVLILAPLAVAEQTVREAKEKMGVEIHYARKEGGHRLAIANYEMMEHFDFKRLKGLVIDESSILKSQSGKIRTKIIELAQNIPYRLACTATPSPNDYTELGNHSQFLGVKTMSEMLSEYFVHDLNKTQDWRLKGHAVKPFWKWVSTWGAMLKRPSDLGYSDEGFALPPLNIHTRRIEIDHRDFWKEGYLFAPDVKTLTDQRTTRKATAEQRVKIAAELASKPGSCLIWCELNDEGDSITAAIPGAVQVKGSDELEDKAKNLLDFASGKIRVLVSKAKIAGFGMNFQVCNRMIFMGVSHSYEMTYQAIRRCWRFGQKKPVDVYVISAETEGAIVENFKRKESDATKMAEEMVLMVKESLISELRGSRKEWNDYKPTVKMEIPEWVGVDA